jgi:hypothetical protein
MDEEKNEVGSLDNMPKSAYDSLSEDEKHGIDGLIEEAKAVMSKQQKIESMKGATIRAIEQDSQGRITKIVLVKDCIAVDLTFDGWGKPVFLLDGEIISS